MSRGQVPDPKKFQPIFGVHVPCWRCHGKGKKGKKECYVCEGTGYEGVKRDGTQPDA